MKIMSLASPDLVRTLAIAEPDAPLPEMRDAVNFHLYGVTNRDDIRYIYSTFPIVQREEERAWGRYRSLDLCLAWQSALLAGQPEASIDL